MLTGKQKRFLRSKAHHLQAIFQVGKDGVNENMLEQLDDVLEKRELIKVKVLQNCLEDKASVAEQLQEGTGAELVQIIGNQIILYRPASEEPKIILPSES
mgnify:CR=1 FL=1